MIRGTTPINVFRLPFDTSAIKTVRILYGQDNKVVFVKTGEDCTLTGNIVSARLTQEDTLKIDYEKVVQIQIRILTVTGDALASGIIYRSFGQLLENEVIT